MNSVLEEEKTSTTLCQVSDFSSLFPWKMISLSAAPPEQLALLNPRKICSVLWSIKKTINIEKNQFMLPIFSGQMSDILIL